MLFSSEGDIANMLTKKHCVHFSQCDAPCFTLIRNAVCVWFHRKEFRFIFFSINSKFYLRNKTFIFGFISDNSLKKIENQNADERQIKF